MARLEEGQRNWVPIFRPSRAEFEKTDFVDYVRKVFNKNPGLAAFKVVPPRGFVAHKGSYDLQTVIETPIRQHAFGRGGAFMCILEEQQPMTAAELQQKSQPVSTNRRAEDDIQERAFWSSITFNPPLYGADTPISMFDDKIPWGWNLRHINCLFKEYGVEPITGVTTPMTYFGTWRSFFGWHKEDCDLMSVNFLHMGAPKQWYCVSPKDAAKFNAMAAQLFPDAARACPAFMRHKDIVISPKVLRDFGIEVLQATQSPGEFIILNAAAYHSGYNLGFNCAEAVNFAVPEWMEVGRECAQCECGALPDAVQLDMSVFFPGLYDSSDEESESEEEEEEREEEEEEEVHEQVHVRSRRGRLLRSSAKAAAAAAAEVKQHDGKEKTCNGAVSVSAAPLTPAKRSSRSAAAAVSSSDDEDHRKGRKRHRQHQHQQVPQPSPKRQRIPTAPELQLPAAPIDLPPGAVHASWGLVADAHPMAVVIKDPDTKELRFELVHRLARKADEPGTVWVGQLEEGSDGLFKPKPGPHLLQLGWHFPKLVRVRTEWDGEGGRRKHGWKLTTMHKRILGV